MFTIIKAIIATINIIAVIILNIPFVMSGNIVDGDAVIVTVFFSFKCFQALPFSIELMRVLKRKKISSFSQKKYLLEK